MFFILAAMAEFDRDLIGLRWRGLDKEYDGAPMTMTETEYLREMDYTTYGESCRDPYVTDAQDLVLCRRRTKHHGAHATRNGAHALTWDADTQRE